MSPTRSATVIPAASRFAIFDAVVSARPSTMVPAWPKLIPGMSSMKRPAPNATIEQTKLFARQINEVYKAQPETRGTFELTYPTGGFGGMVTRPWDERKKTAQQLQVEAAAGLSKIPGIRVLSLIPPSLPGGGDFPVDLVIASTAEPQQLVEIANQVVQKAFASGLFMFADADIKFDQPQTEVVFNRDQVRSQGVEMSQAGQDLSTLLGGNYVNRFSIQGRSYKVIPQVKRSERLSPEQLAFAETFIRCEGKLNRMETEMGLSYPTLRARLNELIEGEYKAVINQRNAEYRALQSQIQPHFIYNTLNSFLGLNRLNDMVGLEKAILALSGMLHYILEGEDWVVLHEEITFIQRYCELQSLRFRDRLTS